jgi:hypothetical protein
MKKSLILILTIFFGLTCKAQVNGQNRFEEGTIKLSSVTYNVRDRGTGYFLRVNNIANPLLDSMDQRGLVKLNDCQFVPGRGIETAFKKVFTKQRMAAFIPEINLLLRYYINGQGGIKYIDFEIRKNTVMTPTELQALEAAIKAEVAFVVLESERDKENYWPITQVIQFKKFMAKYYVE